MGLCCCKIDHDPHQPSNLPRSSAPSLYLRPLPVDATPTTNPYDILGLHIGTDYEIASMAAEVLASKSENPERFYQAARKIKEEQTIYLKL